MLLWNLSIILSVKDVGANGYLIIRFIILLLAILICFLVTVDDIIRWSNVSAVLIGMLKVSVGLPSGWDVCPRYRRDSSGWIHLTFDV